jgi:MFS family permease
VPPALQGFLYPRSKVEYVTHTQQPNESSDPHLRRNFSLGILNGGMFGFAEALMSIDTVLTWFVQQLGGSNFLIGLIGPLRDAGWLLPQLFISHRLQREPLKQPLYRRAAMIRIVAWLIWTTAVFVLAGHPSALLLVFFAAYGVNALASGLAGLPFMEIVAKTIPPDRRGSYFGARMFLGGLLGLLAGVLVSVMLAERNPTPFPQNVGVLLIVAFAAAMVGLAAFALVKEPRSEVRDDGITFVAHLQRAFRLPRQNRDLRYMLLARVAILLSYVAAPFFSIYSINVLGAPPSIIGVYVGVRTLTALAINPLWSRLSDRRGNKLVMQLTTMCGAAMLLWVVLAPPVTQAWGVSADLRLYLFVPVFALMGIYETGIGIGANNLTLEVAPANDRAIYIGLTNTVLGVAYISTVVSGLIVDAVGYTGVFVLGLLLLLLASWALWQLRNPREALAKGKIHVS